MKKFYLRLTDVENDIVVEFNPNELTYTTPGFEPAKLSSIERLRFLYRDFIKAGFEPWSLDKYDYKAWGGYIK